MRSRWLYTKNKFLSLSLSRRYAAAGLMVLAAAGILWLLQVLRGLFGMIVLMLMFGRWSCSELTFDAMKKAGLGIAWVATQVASGKASGGRSGRWLVDDFWAFARERAVDPSSARIPVFIIRGTTVFITPINHCL
ncbi:MAG: hypothetical protein E6J89_18405 [Deltaproteobacteria bacterium]|nr:MAG: hypothetical protein E6J89_18405 [Deltaproteobacteria bacterium]